MNKLYFFKLFLLLCSLNFFTDVFGQRPANDSCHKPKILKIGTSGFGIGTYQSDSVNIDSATIQVGEFFHNSLITAGNDKRSIWFKFYLPTRRGISLELKQNANKIAIKDCGFTTYFSNTCLPGSSEATAAKLTTLNQFGSSFHPCMDPGWYMVQVSAKTRAAGKIYLEITTSFPYEHSAITNAEYDARDSAYYFGNNVVGVNGLNSKYIDFELGCYTVKDSTELFKPIGKNYAAYNQSAWFVFQAYNNSDYTQMAFSSPWTCFTSSDTVAYRLYKGDCRGGGSMQLLDSNFNDFSATCGGYCSDVMKQYKCFFDSGQYYSFQLIFQKDIDKKVRLYLGNTNTHYDSGYYQPKTGIAKDFGVISGAYTKNIGFSCGAYINNYTCSNAMPAAGVKLNNWRYNMNQWVTFTLKEQTRLQVNFTYNNSGNYQYYDQLGFRLFKDTITNNCNDIDTTNIIYKGIGYVVHTIDCLEPGQYAIQLLGTDTISRTSGVTCNGSFHLGKNFSLQLNAQRLPKRSLFSLFGKGQADSINAINNIIEAIPKWKDVYAKTDTIACNNTLRPENSCDTFLTKVIYRVFKIGDVTGDGKADSGMLQINSLNNGSNYRGNHRLYKGNALTLRDNQSVNSYPQKLTGLKPLNECMGKYASYHILCIEPGEYTIASFFDNTSIGLTEKPSFYFYHARSKFDTYSKAEFIDSLTTYGTYYSQADTFTCLSNPDTIDGVSCGAKNSYHVFYLDSIAVTNISSPYYYNNNLKFSLFKGDIRKGKSGLKLYEDNSGKWQCLNTYYGGKTSSQCEPLMPGWYTIMASRDGANYDSAYRVDIYGYSLYYLSKLLAITTSKPTVSFPKYNRPYKAAFVDSLINKNKPLSYDTNYSTKAMPQHLAEFKFPTETYQCGLDTPLTHFPKSALCDNNTSDVAYYVFTLKKNSFVRLINQVGYSAKAKMYDFDVRKDSSKLATATPIQNCNYNAAYFDFCNLKPGKYTLVYFIKRPKDVAAAINPVMYIDSVAYSRFDHAKNAYDFGLIPGDGQWKSGKKGDVHPMDTSLPASHDIITCKTGAQYTDPVYNLCYADYNPNVYLKDTNAVMYPYDSAILKYKGAFLYYNYYGYGPRRNLWYSFVVKGKGTVGVSLTAKEQKYLYYPGNNYRFSIYESDEDGTLSLDSLKKTGKLDSTTSSGLKFICTDTYNPCYYGSDLMEYFSLPACESIKPRRYYLVIDVNNYNPLVSAINLHVSVKIKYDSVFVPETKYDYYSKANNINGFNTQNLLTNGNAEQDKSIGWSSSSGFIQYNYPAPKEGNYCFWGYYNPTYNSEINQAIDISNFASYIDAGKAKTTFSGYLQSASQTNPDEAQLVLEYLNASGSVISSYQSGFKANVGSWLKETHNNTTPANTRKIRVRLQSKDKNSDTYHNTYFDNMVLLQEVDTVKNTPPLKSGIVYKGNIDYFSGATIDTADYGKYYPYCGATNGTVWYKFKVDSNGYLNYNFTYSYLSGNTLLTTIQYSDAYIRLFKNITPGDSLSGLVYQPYSEIISNAKIGSAAKTCVSPGWYYIQINRCNLLSCSDFAFPSIIFDFHRGDFCKTAIPLNIDTLQSVTNQALINCHTIGTDFGEDGSNMGCLYGPKGYKSSWFVVDYTDTTKVDLEFKMSENTTAKPSEIRYRTYYGNCQSLTPAPCNNNALTAFTLDCIKKGTYYVQVVTPDNATGEVQLTVEAKKNVDTTCNPVNIFQPNAVFYYNTSCPENIVEFINTSSRGDSIRYLWDFGYNNKKDTVLNPYFAYPPLKQEKDYTVKLVVRNIARGTKDSLAISVTVPFAPYIDISNKDTALCIGDSVLLKGTISHGKGIWSTGDTSKTITVKKTDWYYYRMQESPKLLINANAEQYPLSNGWTTVSGTWDRTSGYVSVKDSSYYFGGLYNYTAGTYEIYQEVSISNDSLLIDAGLAKTSLISYVQTYPESTPDQSQIVLEYYDTKNNLLAIYQSGLITNIGSWLKLTHSKTTPPKTRKLKVRLQTINTVTGTPNYAFIDNIVLKMRSACDYVDSVYVQINPLPVVNLGKDTSFCWHDSVLLKPKVHYNNPYAVNEPMTNANLTGKLISGASYDAANKNVLLTPAVSNKYGNIEWVDSSLKINGKYEIGFEFWTGKYTTCPGYGTYFYMFNNTSPTSKGQVSGGYSVAFDEYYDQIQTYWNSSQVSALNSGVNLDDKVWKKVKIEYDNQKFTIYLDGVLKSTFTDASSRTQNGFRLGLGAASDYCNNEHRVRKFYVTSNNQELVVIPPLAGRSFNYVWNDSKTDSMRYEKGTKTFTVKVIDQNKCVSKPDTIKITSIKTYDSLFIKKEQICSELDTFRLVPLVKGGIFYGHKAVDTIGLIKVDSAKFGSNSVFYTIKDTLGCTYIDTGFFIVDSVPDIKITPISAVCRNTNSFKLTVNNTDGYFYGGTYIDSAGNFNPKLTSQKLNKVYFRTKQPNCIGRDTITITVDSIPNAAITATGPFCKNGGIKTITPKVNGGGKFSGNYIDSVGKFNPLSANKGNNKIYYTFKDGNNCSNKDSILIKVDTIPNAAINASGPFCKNAGIKTVTAKFNSGGKFSGNFIDSTGKFNPLTANKGNNKIYYTFKDGNNCSNKDSILIRVDTIPNAAITAAGPFCQNGGLKTITAKFNTGGTFSGGSFINTSGSFNPANATKGNNKIYYTFTDGNTCTNKDSIFIKIDTIPNAAITAAGPFCKNGGIKTITPKVNSGGKFSGNYIDSVGKFNPLSANKGNNKIYYTFKDGNNCSNKDSILIKVDTIPNAAINTAGPFCKNAGIKTVTAKFNAGGKFSGSFIDSVGKFNPLTANKGNNKIYYTFKDGNSCSNKDSILIRVDTIPNAAITTAGPFCKNGGVKIITAKVNSGGTFSGGSFINTAGSFNPVNAAKGNNKIYYTFTDGNSCSNKDSILIKVDTIPNAAITAAGPFCKNGGIKTITPKVNSGGKFSGNFIDSTGKFNPLNANKGNYKIYYAFKDGNNCSNKDSILIKVDTIPNAAITAAGPFCKNAGIKTVTAKFNSGGKFSGNFIDTVGKFNPLNANKGNNKIYYTFTDGNSCSNKDSILIRVDTIPNAAITTAGPFCKNGGLQTITAKFNTGGTFSGGSFISSSGSFNAANATKGSNKIYYSFTDGNTCTNKDSILIKVDTIPNATITAAGPFCKNGGIKTITPKVNSGGKFSGNFIDSVGKFNPLSANKGNNKIYYTFKDGNNCSNKDSILIKVDTIPNAAINAAGPYCKNAGIKTVTAKFNSGGKFSGNFIDTIGMFNPLNANKGNNKIYYNFKDGNNCSNKDSILIRVDTLPNAVINAAGPFCKNGGLQTITAKFNTGGTFSGGSFISSSGSFNAANATKGNNKIYYTFTDGNSCSNKDSILVRVDTIPDAAITAAGPFCKNGGIKTITPKVNSGGKFSGNFIDSTGKFNPLTANKGNNKIYYTFKDGNNCSNKDSILIKVDTIPNASINIAGPYCKNAGIKTVTASYNSGGKFSGNFIDTVGKFNPLNANKGNNKIYYTFKDGNNCSNKDSILIRVDTIPNAAINAAGPFCQNGGLQTITAKFNTGGAFSGGSCINATGNFNPANAAKGNNKIYYSFTDGNSCSNKDSILIKVDTIPNAAITAAGPFCKNGGIKTITPKVNSGGKFSGNFIDSTGKFNPLNANKGNNKIYYTFKDGNNCSNKDSILIKVDTIPNAAINSAGPYCKNAGIKTISAAYNSGGKFSGNFIDTVGKFNPLNANKGNNKIYYTFKDGNSCSNKDSILIRVDTIPNVGLNAAGPFCNLDNNYDLSCKNINLTYVYSGGTFVNTSGRFFPNLAVIGTNKVYALGTDNNSCNSKDSINIIVFKIPDASINPIPEICADSTSIQIVPVVSGGTFSGGSFVSNTGIFYPPIAKTGLHKVYYDRITNGCFAKDSILVTVRAVPIPNVSVTPLTGCEPLEVILKSKGSYKCEWKSNGTIINTTDSFAQILMQGLYTIDLKLTTAYGCEALVKNLITVHPKPTAGFKYVPDEIFARITTVDFLNKSLGSITGYEWFVDGIIFNTNKDATNQFTDTGNFDIRLIVSNNQGCKDTADARLFVIDEFRVFIPNVLSPNGDGLNDFFFPAGIGIDKVQLQVFDRWGEKLHDGNTKWDCTYKGKPVQDGSYIYFLTIIDVQGFKHFIKGSVTVLR